MIYICIPTFHRLSYTIKCINSIYDQVFKDYKIVICEHSPTEENYNELQENFPEIIFLRGNEEMWWSGAINRCVAHVMSRASDNDYVFTLNNDTELDEDCLKKLTKTAAEHPDSIIGCVNLLYDQKSRIEPSAQKRGKFFGLNLYRSVNCWGDDLKEFRGIIEVNALSGKGVLIPVSIFKTIGLYNAEMLPHYHADTEFTIRASRAGFKVLLNYSAKIYSHHKETGLTARTSGNTLKAFLRGFSSVKSTRHYPTLKNRAKLIHGDKSHIYFLVSLIGVWGGFIRRYTITVVSKLLNKQTEI